jgi:isoleucyl-tRNA synthetase
MLAPILAFTADEAWEFVPGKTAESVHRSDWRPQGLARSEAEVEAWKSLLLLRDLALPALEKARQAKEIGKALEARLTLTGSGQLLADARANAASLRELLNVSQVQLAEEAGAVVTASDSRADGEKCERCWHWETDVGSHVEHPTICGRCVKAVQGSARP